MSLTTLNELNQSRGSTEVFGGYNHNLRINDGEFHDCRNTSSRHYPCLAPRQKRGTYEYPSSPTPVTHAPNGLIAKDTLCHVDGTKLFIGNAEVQGLTLTDTRKQLISMGAYIIIMPDKKYVNTADLTDKGSIEATFTSTVAEDAVSFTLSDSEGKAYEGAVISGSAPADPTDKALWIDTSETPHALKRYSSSSAVWTQIATTYVKIKTPHIASSFKQYDGVKIAGISSTIGQLAELNGKTSILYGAYHDPGDSTISPARAEGTDDYIVVVGMIDEVTRQSAAITVSRTMPEMDFVIESGNRLWGCRYGTDRDGKVVNEIYASKLGDFRNWDVFMGVSTDSYAASCGSDGQWTGAITHLGYPVFFKENCLHKVYGNYPANFQIQTTACRGVMKGAGQSLAIVNEVLYYKSRNGVCAYDGSLPSEIGSVFGEIHYSAVDTADTDVLRNGAVAGAHNNSYYISMKSETDGLWHMFSYDASTGFWHHEDNTRALAFCSCRNELYFIDGTAIRTVFGSGTQEPDFDWFTESGFMGTDAPDTKYISRLQIRMTLGIGTRIRFLLEYDSSGVWEEAARLDGVTLRTFSIPVRPRRCDHFRLRIEGHGDAKIFSIVRTIESGSGI